MSQKVDGKTIPFEEAHTMSESRLKPERKSPLLTSSVSAAAQ